MPPIDFKWMKWLGATGTLLAMLLVGLPLAAAEKGGACVACHSQLGGNLARPVSSWRGSIHEDNDITCDLCHGGNADVTVGRIENLTGNQFNAKKDAAMSAAAGFIGVPDDGQAQFDLCSQCHPDAVSRYAGSIMGKAYLDKRGGPSCVTCHQAHDNKIPAVPDTCKSCHQDTSGFSEIDPMAVTEATITRLSEIRIRDAGRRARGARPGVLSGMPAELDSYQVGLVAFGAVLILFLLGWLIMAYLERKE